MRLIGWILVLGGGWSVWTALAGEGPVGAGGLLMLLIGLTLLSRRGRAVAAWIGEGVLTGLALFAGLLLSGLGGLLLLAYGEFVAEGLRLPVESLTIPLVFLGGGLLLIALGVRRLLRQSRDS